MKEWDAYLANLPDDTKALMQEIRKNPSPESVRKLQQLIGMTYQDTNGHEIDNAE